MKIHQALEQMCTEQNCRAAFKAAGLIVLIKPSNPILKEIIGFNVHECKKVRGYNISYILNLVEKQIIKSGGVFARSIDVKGVITELKCGTHIQLMRSQSS